VLLKRLIALFNLKLNHNGIHVKVVSDIRQRTTMHNFIAHQSRIRSIAIDTENNALITGSIDGELKVNSINYK
jgi:hypothetical protein